MVTLGKIFAVLFWIPLIIWASASTLLENIRGPAPAQEFEAGVTFSILQTKVLGLDPEKTYLALLDDLGVKNLRLVAYWSEIEKEPGSYDFSWLDFEVREAEERQAKVILAVGMKLPRWPECHLPAWTKGILKEERELRLMEFVSRVVGRYRNSPAITSWQVENEPFFKFGSCPEISRELVQKEIDLVRLVDSRPILISDSGELGTWFRAARLGDIVGTTMYLRNLTPRFGYLSYPLPPRFYEKKAKLIKRFFGDDVIVVEMQAEPWLASPRLADFSIEEQFKGLDFERFKSHLRYARASRLSPVYFWGAEWWYWLKENGHPEFWNYVKKEIFKK